MSKRDIISGYYMIWSSEMILWKKKLQPSVRSVRYCRTLLSAWWVSGLYGEDGLWAAGQNTQTSISGIHHWMSALIRHSVDKDQKWSGNKCNKPRRTTTTTWSPAAVYFFTIISLWLLSLKNLHILSASQCGSKLRRWYLLASSHSTTGWRHTKFNLD